MSNEDKWTTLKNELMLTTLFGNRIDATKSDLDSFKAFLLLLKFHCVGKMEVYHTLIKLLHMYHHKDGYEAYSKLIQVLCVLLVQVDSNVLSYLLSIIPLPQTFGQNKLKNIQEDVKRISGISLLSIPTFHCSYAIVTENEEFEPDVSNSTKNSSVNGISDTETILCGKDEIRIEEPSLKECQLMQVTGSASGLLLNEISLTPDSKSVADFSDDGSSEPFDQLSSEGDSIKISEQNELLNITDNSTTNPVDHIPMFDLNPDMELKKSIKSFIAKVYDSSSYEANGILVEKSKNKNNKGKHSNINDAENKIPEPKEHLLLTCPQNKAASSNTEKSFICNIIEGVDDSDIEILEVEENNNEKHKYPNFREGTNRECVQTTLENKNEVSRKDERMELTERIISTPSMSEEQMSIASAASISPSFSRIALNISSIKKDEVNKLQEKNVCTSNQVQNYEKQDHIMPEIMKNCNTSEVQNATSSSKEVSELLDISVEKAHGQQWSEENAKLLGINLRQNEEISLKNDISTPVTIIPSIPVAHGFKRYRSYTSAEHLAYLHEIALEKLTELKTSNSCNTHTSPHTPEIIFEENKMSTSCAKDETGQKPEIKPKENISQKKYIANPLGETRNSSWSECYEKTTPRISRSTYIGSSNVYIGYDMPKMGSQDLYSISKSNNITTKSPPSPPPSLPPPQSAPPLSSSSSSSTFNIAPIIPPQSRATADGQEWRTKVPESRKPIEPLWATYRPLYQPYALYDSRIVQQRMQLSQRPIMIAQPSSTMGTYLEQPHGCVSQYGGRFWGMYSPLAHRIYSRQTAHSIPQQRVLSTSSDVIPHFIPHAIHRINTAHPVYLAQQPKMSPDVIPQFTSQPPQSKCKNLEAIVGRLKENDK